MRNIFPEKRANLERLNRVAVALEELCEDVMFVGGCALGMLINADATPDVRFTQDVDCIVDVVSLMDYQKLENLLRKKSFKQSLHESVICRWQIDDVTVDIMPTRKSILGFGNDWYESALSNPLKMPINRNIVINVIDAPHFIATKIEAFESRGKNDYMLSHDMEDILSVIDGRVNIVHEILNCTKPLKAYLKEKFLSLIKNDSFIDALGGHLNYDSNVAERIRMMLNKIEQITQG